MPDKNFMKYPPFYAFQPVVVFLIGIFFLSSFVGVSTSHAETRESLLQGLTSKKRKTIIQSIKTIAQQNDPWFLPALEALADKKLQSTKDGRVLLVNGDEQAEELLTGETVSTVSLNLQKPRINNQVRRILFPTIAQLQLVSPDPAIRLLAAEELSKRPKPEAVPSLYKALDKETEDTVREALALTLALTELKSDTEEKRLNAVAILGDSGSARAKAVLLPLTEKNEDGSYKETNAAIRQAAEEAVRSIDNNLAIVEFFGNLFRGVSLGSVLLLAALGLAITFGLMRVINMAHGEMLMIGAYTTYVTQNIFAVYLSDWFAFYLLVSIPLAFAVSAVIGMVMERTVIRYLYGRSLETLLATWGISLLLIQTVRVIFGAQNVEVANPQWLSGGMQVAQGLVFPYSRIAIIGFVVFVVLLVWVLFQKTNLGLKVRAVTQNREMASCLGISSSKTDMWTFGLGSGIAGLGGVALSQIGNVGPELGQGYIVDSFMVVVLGGVGKLIGTVVSALGLGIINKYMEPMVGAVLGKILILVFIILFIQKRPQGLFALKGRSVEDR